MIVLNLYLNIIKREFLPIVCDYFFKWYKGNWILLSKYKHDMFCVWPISKCKFKRTFTSLSRISQLNMAGLAFLYSSMRLSTSGVATLGLLPPITPGRMLPVSWYRLRIFDTQPCDTRSCRDMTQGRTPAAAISTIFSRIWLGSGRPLMNTPPSWFIRPWPTINNERGVLIVVRLRHSCEWGEHVSLKQRKW